MKLTGYLITDQSGSARFVKRLQSVRAGELVVELNLTIPNRLFQKPAVIANIDVPDFTNTDDIAVDVNVRTTPDRYVDDDTEAEHYYG